MITHDIPKVELLNVSDGVSFWEKQKTKCLAKAPHFSREVHSSAQGSRHRSGCPRWRVEWECADLGSESDWLSTHMLAILAMTAIK